MKTALPEERPDPGGNPNSAASQLRPFEDEGKRVLTDGGGRSGDADDPPWTVPSVDNGNEGGDEPGDSITEGGLVRPMIPLAWPIMVIQLLQVAYNVVDTLYLGRLSADAVGALSIAFPLIILLLGIVGGFISAGAVLVAQYTGAEGTKSAGKVLGQTVTVVGALAVLVGVVGFAFTEPALELLPSGPDTATDVVPLAAKYVKIIFLGTPFLAGFVVFLELMRGYGDTKTPMYVMGVSVVTNIMLDPILIFGFANNPLFAWTGLTGLGAALHSVTGFTGWGIEGAAGSSVVSRGLGMILGFGLMFATDVGPAVEFGHLFPDRGYVEDLVRLGTPMMVEQSAGASAMIALTAVVVTFSPPVVAAYGLGNRIVSLVFLPTLGVGRAVGTMVGQNLGAEEVDRAARAVYLAGATAGGVMVAVAGFVFGFTEPIVGVFLGDVPRAAETIALGVEYLRIRSLEFTFLAITQVLLGAFRGAGNTKTAMVISLSTLWVGRVSTVTLLVFVLGWGVNGVWVGMAFGNVLGAAIGVTWFLRGTWREKYIDEEKLVEADLEDAPGVDET